MLTHFGINTKLTLIMLTCILLSLLMAGIADAFYDRSESYRANLEELSVLAKVIADRTSAAVVFNDPGLAEENLNALSARSTIVGACAFNESGNLVATYRRMPSLAICNAALGRDAVHEFPDYIDIVTGILLDGNRVGEIHIRSDLRELHERLDRFLIFAVGVAIAATVIVLWVSRHLQAWVAQPLLDLSERAHRVARDQDYSIRAKKAAEDELGILVDAFNGMLETIETQSRKLMDANVQLEQRVSDRSAELRDAQANLLRQERLATLGQLTGTVSHELRNPLGTIQASIDVLRSRLPQPTDDLERTLDRITRNIHRCENIINELLDYSRGARPHLQTVAVRAWLQDILEPYADNPDVPVSLYMPDDLQCEMDPERMQRAVVNVIDNAIHALTESDRSAAARFPRIQVSAMHDQTYLRIRVEDNGPGIPDTVMERIFEPLFSTRAFGVGLGLAIVQQILEMHDGEVIVTSQEQLGTQVELRLPIKDAGRLQHQVAEE